MKTLLFLFLISLSFVPTDSSTCPCVKELVDKAFDPNFNADYFLIIPVETSKAKKGRLFILKSNFKKYMTILDSTYTDNEKLKHYVKEVLSGSETMYFHEVVYKEDFKETEYKILSEKNPIDISTAKKKNAFLNKFLYNYSPDRKYFNLNTSYPDSNYYFIYENLFNLNYLVASGDGVISVFKINCK